METSGSIKASHSMHLTKLPCQTSSGWIILTSFDYMSGMKGPGELRDKNSDVVSVGTKNPPFSEESLR